MARGRVVFGAVAAVSVGLMGLGGESGGAVASSVATSEPPATDGPDVSAAPTDVSAAPGVTVPVTQPSDESVIPPTDESEWATIVPGGDCECADGGEFSFFAREADPTKVVFFLEGGGACFSAETCAFTEEDSTTYDWNIGPDEHPDRLSGIFDLENPANPFADYSFVYVPYCTGDVHLGDTTREYSPEPTVEHNGWVNATTALGYLAETFPDAEQVVVVGESAGSIAAAVYAGLASDVLVDWVTAVVNGNPPDDVHCEECEAP